MLQAFADLAIPNLTSQIVDVGIMQSGVETTALDKLTEKTYHTAIVTSDDKTRELIERSYDGQAGSDGYYTLNSYGQGHKEELEKALSYPLILSHSTDDTTIDSLSQLFSDYDQGMKDRQRAIELIDDQKDKFGGNDDAIEQVAINAAKQEYEDVGESLADLQIGFLIRVGALMLLLAGASMMLSIGVGFVASRTGARIGYDLRNQLYKKVVSFSEKEISRFSTASLITRGTNDIQLIQNVSIMLMRMILFAPILSIGGIIMVMVTNAQMGWIIAVAIVAVFVVIGIVFKVALPKFKIMQKLIDKVNRIAREILNGMPVIRAFDRQLYEQNRFDVASMELMRTQLFTNRVMTFMMPTMMLIMNATSVAIVWFGSSFIDQGGLQTGDLIAFITYSMVIIMGFLMLGMVAIMLPRAQVAAERIKEVVNTEPEIMDRTSDADHDVIETLASFGDEHNGVSIVFNDVCFRYEESDEYVLEDVSFEIEPGQTVAVIGATGSGKSTIIKLIERFYDTTSGSIYIDGVAIGDIPLSLLRSLFGYVPQKAFLFNGTIKSNVAYADESMDPERIDLALESAQALEFVRGKEDGIDSEISQGGTNVSGGQRQRLSIARAFATNARAYLFDDCFSALDYKTDAALRAAIKANYGNVTQLIVAQRISTIMDADKIIVLDEGKIVGMGTHDELMRTCDEYQEIACSQLSLEELEGR